MGKRCVFTYTNFQIQKEVVELNKQVCEKFTSHPHLNCNYQLLNYNGRDYYDVTPDQVIDYGLKELFFTQHYDTILILDIDCVPLNLRALEYTFEQAEKHILVGNVQRSNHIENDKHVYPAPSCVCITREMFGDLGFPSFGPTNRGDIGEELSYIAEQKSIPIEMFIPSHYETFPYQQSVPWDLNDELPKYGIGTTFVNSDGEELFYHLFQCRLNVFNQYFFDKCNKILTA